MPKIIEYFFRTFNESEEFIRMKQQYIYLFAGILSLWCAFLPFTQEVSERGSLIIHSVVLCSLTAAGFVLCLFKKQEAGVDIMFVTAGIYIVFYTGYFSDTFYLAALMILSLNAFLLHGKRYQYFIFTIAILAGLYMKYLRNMSDETIVFAVMGLAFLLILFIVKKNLNKIILSGSTLKEKILENQSISSQLEKAEQNAQKIRSMLNIGTWKYDMFEKKFEGSPEFYKILGISEKRQKISAHEIFQKVIDEDKSLFRSVILKNGNDDIHKVEIRLRDESFGSKTVNMIMQREVNNIGVAVSITGIISDNACTRKPEIDFNMARKIFEVSKDSIVISNGDDQVIYANKAYMENTGYSRNEIIGKKIKAFESQKNNVEVYNFIKRSVTQNYFWEGEMWTRKKSGEDFMQLVSITLLNNETDGGTYTVFVSRDLTEIMEKNESLEKLLKYDLLTGLPNQNSIKERLCIELENMKKESMFMGFIVIDVKNFKRINDVLGHNEGDRILVQIAERIAKFVVNIDCSSRLSSDEFGVIISGIHDLQEFLIRFESLNLVLNKPYFLNDKELDISFKYGLSFFPDDSDDPRIIFQNAITALHYAKKSEESFYEFFTKEMSIRSTQNMQLEEEMRQALVNNEFSLVYQPQVDLKTKEIIGFEALVRWNSRNFGLIPPPKFIPLAEESKIIIDLGDWILEQACLQNKKWQDIYGKKVVMAVNLSIIQFEERNFVEKIKKVLEKVRLRPEYLEIEITEGIVAKNMEEVLKKLSELKNIGVRIAIDDFGTGYSSLSYIKKFPIDKIKIDRSFIKDYPHYDNGSIAKTVIDLSHNLDFSVIAEGVETEEQIEFLEKNNCDSVQGYYFFKPLSESDVAKLFENKY